ncbi:MAG: hypothetical protein ACKOJB_06350, partial [Chthoniobacterales bacterium]
MRLSRRAAWNTFFAVCAVALIACASVWGGKKLFGKPAGAIGTKYELQPGPWGEITAQPILIEAPASLISPNFQLGDGRWYFAARTPDDVAKFLRDAGLTSEQIARLVPNLQQVPSVDGLLSVAPPEDLVRSLSEDVRSHLYDKLAAIPQNFAQVEPFRTTALHLDAWLDERKLPPDLIAEVKSLMWHRGSGLFFSDYNIVAAKITSPALKVDLVKQLTHKSSVILTLHVPADDKVDQLVDYYGVHDRRDKVEPLLKGLAEAGGGNIGMANMLPAFPRVRLYRFPDPLPGKDISPDCHWSSFNFFSRGLPDDGLNDPAYVGTVLCHRHEIRTATGTVGRDHRTAHSHRGARVPHLAEFPT